MTVKWIPFRVANSSDADSVTGIGQKTPPRVRISRQTPFQSASPMKPSRGAFFGPAARWASSALGRHQGFLMTSKGSSMDSVLVDNVVYGGLLHSPFPGFRIVAR